MFAVKGWSVDSSALKTQANPNAEAQKNKAAAGADGEAPQKSNKRKRAKDKAMTVTAANVGDMWARTIEGKKDAPAPKKDRKKQKTDADADAVTEEDKQVKSEETEGKSTEEQGEKKGKKNKKGKDDNNKAASAIASTVPPPAPAAPVAKLTPMQAAMRQKLISARFRHLNETLYTAPSTTSLDLFAENPEMFDDYHSGFRQQVTTWPENPVDNFVRAIRERSKVKIYNQNRAFRDKKRGKEPVDSPMTPGVTPLPRTHGTCTIADLGCGDARLAEIFSTGGEGQKSALKILSYDLQSNTKLVTKADIANLPLKDGSVDVAIFCLALMGTNWIDFIEEAYRVLHWKGELWVAEIKSRFGRVGGDKGKQRVVEHSVGNKRKAAAKEKVAVADRKKKEAEEHDETLRTVVDEDVVTKSEETDVSGFIDVLKRRGFLIKDEKAVDLSNRMFVKMEFIKAAPATVGKNVKEEEEERKGQDGTFKKKFKKFVEPEIKEVSVEDEAKVLKPCLYKIR